MALKWCQMQKAGKRYFFMGYMTWSKGKEDDFSGNIWINWHKGG